MTRVDFYILQDDTPQAAQLFTCRLSEKAWKQGHRIFIHTESATQLKQLDDLLWTFRAGSFLPHAVYREAGGPEPVQLGQGVDPLDQHEVLVNLGGAVPPFFSRFDRVAEPVSADETSRTAARERFRFYQDRGYRLETHKL